MKFRHKKREKLDITLISMIDVLFVLLLFFMVSTTFNRNTEVKVTLPEANGAEAEQSQKMVTLMITANGEYYLKGEDGVSHELVNQQIETLKQELQKLVEHSKDQPFIKTARGSSVTRLQYRDTAHP